MYGYYYRSKWFRVVVKFSRENKKVIHFLDSDGVYDFREGMVVREIKSRQIIDMDVGQIKVFVHAIAKFKPTGFFKDIFAQVLLKTPVTAVFSLVEQKNELVHESYAGDFIYEVNGKLRSFREILIREKVTSPRLVTGDFNKMLFEKRAAILAPNNILTKGTISDYQPSISDDRSTISCDVIELIDERFEIHKHVLGEGTVYILYLNSFY